MTNKVLNKKVLITALVVIGVVVLGLWGSDLNPQLFEVLKQLVTSAIGQ